MSVGNSGTGQQGLASQRKSPVPITATECVNWVKSRGPDQITAALNQPSQHLRIHCPFSPSTAHFSPRTWLFSLHASRQPGQRAGRHSPADCEMGDAQQGPRCSSHPVGASWCPKPAETRGPPIPHRAGPSDPSPAPAVPSSWHQQAARKRSRPNPSLVEPH